MPTDEATLHGIQTRLSESQLSVLMSFNFASRRKVLVTGQTLVEGN